MIIEKGGYFICTLEWNAQEMHGLYQALEEIDIKGIKERYLQGRDRFWMGEFMEWMIVDRKVCIQIGFEQLNYNEKTDEISITRHLGRKRILK